MSKIGILLTNTGTPDAPTRKAVKRYLREFLSDKRVVKLPRPVWLPILYGIILPFRSGKSASLYQNIWLNEQNDSPMRHYMRELADKLTLQLNNQTANVIVEVGMNYGQPSIKSALNKLHKHGIDKLIVLPLYPQYSNATTASSFDRVAKELKKWRALPEIIHFKDYSTHPAYIRTLANSVKTHWQSNPAKHLLISFHGLPERFVTAGDPYAKQCENTATLLANELALTQDQWTLCYQSQFGYDKWLKPSTQDLIDNMPKQGHSHIDIICPGFSIDCLETLEEIGITGKEAFQLAGGENLSLIPCLNDDTQHVDLLADILTDKLRGSTTHSN